MSGVAQRTSGHRAQERAFRAVLPSPLRERRACEHQACGKDPDGRYLHRLGRVNGYDPARAPLFRRFDLRQVGQKEPQVASSDRSKRRSLSAVEFFNRQPSMQMVVDESRRARVSLGIAHAQRRLLRVTPWDLHLWIVAHGGAVAATSTRDTRRTPAGASCRVNERRFGVVPRQQTTGRGILQLTLDQADA